MFFTTVFLYPLVLALLCAGAGLLVDRLSGGFLPAPLLLAVGAAALIGLSQLTTYIIPLAPATPYIILGAALAGFAVGAERVRALAGRLPALGWLLAVPVLAYLIAMAPVIAVGRPSFSSFAILGDSAVHMMGADFLIRHGQDYSHLDLRNTYGQYINGYYNNYYPSGSDTLFGGSSFLLGLRLIWAFQPFNAFMLAIASGPAWILVRRIGLGRFWSALAALTVVVPALVYGYELIASVKEITALPLMLTLGALVVVHRSWLGRGAAHVIPFALTLAAGVSALGVAFGVWGLVAAVVLAVVAVDQIRSRRLAPARALASVGVGALALLVAAWPTWVHFSGAVRIANNIASTSNSGNLHSSLKTSQVFGVWLVGTYKLPPHGTALLATQAAIAVIGVAAVVGAARLLRLRAYALAGWIGCTLLAWLLVSNSVTTWAEAKTLVLTSPILVLLAWAGVAAVRAAPGWLAPPVGAGLLAAVIVAGILGSDALQYRNSNLAPTARYQELASVDARFAGEGPTLFTDYDEYALYVLRDMDIGAPNFPFQPVGLRNVAIAKHPVQLDRLPPQELISYPLIVTRRDPIASRPSSAYTLLWQGSYYQVWGRRPGAATTVAHLGLSGSPRAQCTRIGRLAQPAVNDRASVVAAVAPEVVKVPLAQAPHPETWGQDSLGGFIMRTAGAVSASFRLPAAGVWDLWVQGHFARALKITIDGRPTESVSDQLGGDSLIPSTAPPLPLRLPAGVHRLTATLGTAGLAPGGGAGTILDAVFLTPGEDRGDHTLESIPAADWRDLCGRRYPWVEVVWSEVA
jgi:hypothetical protein